MQSSSKPPARKDPVQTHQISVSRGRDSVNQIREKLFEFPEVLEVFITGRPDSLVVVCSGRPRPGEWLRALRAIGYEVSARRRPPTTASEGAHRQAHPSSSDRADRYGVRDDVHRGRLASAPPQRYYVV
jgi:hypothetical protein